MNGNLIITNLSHSYGKNTILSNLNISIQSEKITALVGPSGAGKSTILRLIAGIEMLQAGEIKLEGHWTVDKYHYLAPEKRKIGFVFQDGALFPHYDVKKNIAFGLFRLKKKEALIKVEKMLELIQLEEYANFYPHQLSGGQQQRVALARALVTEPALLLLDEPFSHLDVKMRAEVRSEVIELVTQSKTTCIWVTHDPEEASLFANNIFSLINNS